jgi:hypothetical protein
MKPTYILLLGLGVVATLSFATCAKDKAASRDKTAGSANETPAPPPGGRERIEVPGMKSAPPDDGAKGLEAAATPAPSGPDASYTVTVDAPSSAPAKAEQTVRVKVAPGDGYKMNEEFPTSLTVTAPDGVSVAKAKQLGADAEKLDANELVFTVKFTPSSTGDKAFAAQLKFAVCTDVTCDPKTKDLAWAVAVQ